MYELIPASGTPIKFTRSFAAKARARANVPIKTIGFKISIFVVISRNWRITNHNIKLPPRIIPVFSKINVTASGERNAVPFAPLTKIKYVIAVKAIEPQIAPYLLILLLKNDHS